MANINIKFNNKDYLLSCDKGQEENLEKLANHLDLKYNGLKKNLGNIGESKLLLITAIQMVDDYFDLSAFKKFLFVLFWRIKKQIKTWKQLLFLGLLFRLIFICATPNLSQDFYRYLWDGNLKFR